MFVARARASAPRSTAQRNPIAPSGRNDPMKPMYSVMGCGQRMTDSACTLIRPMRVVAPVILTRRPRRWSARSARAVPHRQCASRLRPLVPALRYPSHRFGYSPPPCLHLPAPTRAISPRNPNLVHWHAAAQQAGRRSDRRNHYAERRSCDRSWPRSTHRSGNRSRPHRPSSASAPSGSSRPDTGSAICDASFASTAVPRRASSRPVLGPRGELRNGRERPRSPGRAEQSERRRQHLYGSNA